MPLPTQIVVGGSSVTWHETTDSGSGEQNPRTPSSERRWLVTKCYDIQDLIATASANIPMINPRGAITHFFQSYRYEAAPGSDGGLWTVVAQYGFAVDYFELSFDTSGGTTKALMARDQGTYYNCVDPTVAPTENFGPLIGVTDSTVEGVEIPDPKFDFTVLIRNKFSTLPASYLDTLESITGKTNDRPIAINWKGQVLTFGQEELLFRGAPGKMTSEDGFELSLKFSKSKSDAGGTALTAPYTQPIPDGTVSVFVADGETLFEPGQLIYIQNGGVYEILSSIIDGGPLPDQLNLRHNSAYEGAAEGAIVPIYSAVCADHTDTEPIVFRNSGAIKKLGWHYVWTRSTQQNVVGRKTISPMVAVVNQVMRTDDFYKIGIFSAPPGS